MIRDIQPAKNPIVEFLASALYAPMAQMMRTSYPLECLLIEHTRWHCHFVFVYSVKLYLNSTCIATLETA